MIRPILLATTLTATAVCAGAHKHSYREVENIGELAVEMRRTTAEARSHSFSRAWFDWELLLRRYIDEGREDENALKMLGAFFRGAIFDRYRALEAKGEGDMLYLFHTSMSGNKSAVIGGGRTFQRDVHGGQGHGGWGGHARMLIYEELVAGGVLTADEQALYRTLVVQSLREQILDFGALERGANNRPYKNTGGLAAALRIFPDMPRAADYRAWIDRQWRELTEYGDIFEVNHFPYAGLHLTALMEIATETGKIKQPEDRKLIESIARRCLLFNHGMGVRGNPNSGANSFGRSTQEEVFANPWHAAIYGDILVPDYWYRAAKEFRDSQFLWAAVQTSIGAEPPRNTKLHRTWTAAYQKRFRWFVNNEIGPEAPKRKSQVGLLSPTKYKINERLYLGSGRGRERPFASFYIYDRNNEYMHCFDDMMGQLYEYCADGAKLLGSSGKYNGIFIGQPFYNMLLVRHPRDSFPLHLDGRLDQSAGTWRRASCSLPDITHSRTGPDSKNWIYRPDLHDHWTWRRKDDPVGATAANMDGLAYLNNNYTLKSVTIRLNGSPDAKDKAEPDRVMLRNLRLAGPKGVVMLHSFADPDFEGIKLTRRKAGEEGAAWKEVKDQLVSMDGAAIVRVDPGYKYALRIGGFEHSFDLANDYTRVTFDFVGVSDDEFMRFRRGWRYGQTEAPALVADMVLNDRTVGPSHDIRGGVLVQDSIRAEDRGGDSYGSFAFRNYFGGQSTWQRDTVLTSEGYLVVRDVYTAGADTDGYRAGPIWNLRADGRWVETERPNGTGHRYFHNEPPGHDGKRHWFHAPPFDQANWQDKKKRVLVYIHPESGQTYGQLQHESTPDYSRDIRNNCSWASALVKVGKPKVFLSVLMPFEDGADPVEIADEIRTRSGGEGVEANFADTLTVKIGADGSWAVERQAGR